MGVFPMPAPKPINVAPINMIYFVNNGCTNSYDPWVIPTLKEIEYYGASMPLLLAEQADFAIQPAKQYVES